MNYFELAIVGVVLILIVLFLLKKLNTIIIIAIIILGFIHPLLFGNRWQFYPLYVIIGLLVVYHFIKKTGKFVISKLVKWVLIALLLLGVVFSISSMFIFPVEELPKPSGEFMIGTTLFEINDVHRDEIYTEEVDNRKFKIQIWYPAKTTEGYEQALWIDDGVVVTRALSEDFGFPRFMLDQVASIESNSYYDAPIKDGVFPVVILSHGWGGFRNLHTDLAEELASNGYIIVGIEHTYGSVATVFEDEIIYGYDDALPPRETTDDFLDYANRLVTTYAGDIKSTIDYIYLLHYGDVDSDLTGSFDLDHIGVVGHSTGGGATVLNAITDQRVDSIIGLDAWVEPLTEETLSNGLSIPSLYLRSEDWEEGYNNEDLYFLLENSSNSALYQIDGTTHFDFAMVSMYSPLTKVIGFSGSIDQDYFSNMSREIVLVFFDETLKEKDEVIDFTIWNEISEVDYNIE